MECVRSPISDVDMSIINDETSALPAVEVENKNGGGDLRNKSKTTGKKDKIDKMFAMMQDFFEKNTPNTTPNKSEEEKIEIVKDDKFKEKKGAVCRRFKR